MSHGGFQHCWIAADTRDVVSAHSSHHAQAHPRRRPAFEPAADPSLCAVPAALHMAQFRLPLAINGQQADAELDLAYGLHFLLVQWILAGKCQPLKGMRIGNHTHGMDSDISVSEYYITILDPCLSLRRFARTSVRHARLNVAFVNVQAGSILQGSGTGEKLRLHHFLGGGLWAFGWAVNLNSDSILHGLRKPGETGVAAERFHCHAKRFTLLHVTPAAPAPTPNVAHITHP